MAKIHVRGGSPLRLEFEDDNGNPLAVQLEAKGSGKGEYFVINDATKDRIQTYQDGNKNIFRETNPNSKSCEVSYMEKKPDPKKRVMASATS